MTNPVFRVPFIILLLFLTSSPGFGMISLKSLNKEEAGKLGLTMKSRPNGEAGVKVWLEFRKEGALESFTYAELRMVDETGKHLVSAMLKPQPVVLDQEENLVSVSFSVDPSQLKHCTFWLVTHSGLRTGVGYTLKVTNFLEAPANPKE